MRTVLAPTLALVAALSFGGAGRAADTDVENPSLRELPLQRGGPISGGKQHQPTQAEIDERTQMKQSAAQRNREADDLYQRVLKQSQQGTPRSLDPEK